jgi:hypothetical protein
MDAALLEQLCTLPLAERLQLRDALDDSLNRELPAVQTITDRESLEQALLDGLASGEPRVVDRETWNATWSRLEHSTERPAS